MESWQLQDAAKRKDSRIHRARFPDFRISGFSNGFGSLLHRVIVGANMVISIFPLPGLLHLDAFRQPH